MEYVWNHEIGIFQRATQWARMLLTDNIQSGDSCGGYGRATSKNTADKYYFKLPSSRKQINHNRKLPDRWTITSSEYWESSLSDMICEKKETVPKRKLRSNAGPRWRSQKWSGASNGIVLMYSDMRCLPNSTRHFKYSYMTDRRILSLKRKGVRFRRFFGQCTVERNMPKKKRHYSGCESNFSNCKPLKSRQKVREEKSKPHRFPLI